MTLNFFERVLLQIAPRRAVDRLRARAVAETLYRHYEAAQGGRRTEHWKKVSTDANAANAAIGTLRNLSRDLVRNNGWARNAKRVIARNTIGWGIVPTPTDAGVRAATTARRLWKQWAGSTQCDLRGQRNFSGLQRLAMGTIVESGEVLVRRYRQSTSRGLAIPLQLQVLEPDYLDTTRDNVRTASGGKIIQGVEYDASGRLVAYWLLPEHPGASYQLGVSRMIGGSQRVPAEDVLHIYDIDRAGQVRGVSWFAAAIVKLKEFDEFEDAQLLRQKIAACLAVFITDIDGANLAIGDQTTDVPAIETIEPGTILRLPTGKQVTSTDPPQVVEGGFTERTLRGIAAGMGITYEDQTGDYSRVNFSSARMSRLAHWANVYDWQWNMVIPMLCEPVWRWAMETALIAGSITETPTSEWTPQPMPMIEPDREALANIRRVRGGHATPDQVLRELGLDPDTHWKEYAANLTRLDALGIVLDSDARKTTQAGNPTTPATATDEGASAAGEE